MTGNHPSFYLKGQEISIHPNFFQFSEVMKKFKTKNTKNTSLICRAHVSFHDQIQTYLLHWLSDSETTYSSRVRKLCLRVCVCVCVKIINVQTKIMCFQAVGRRL